MNSCNGPCEQGRKPCPCPQQCEQPDGLDDLEMVGLLAICAVALVSVLGLIAFLI